MLKTARSYLHSSGQNTGTWRTDGQTARGYYSTWILKYFEVSTNAAVNLHRLHFSRTSAARPLLHINSKPGKPTLVRYFLTNTRYFAEKIILKILRVIPHPQSHMPPPHVQLRANATTTFSSFWIIVTQVNISFSVRWQAKCQAELDVDAAVQTFCWLLNQSQSRSREHSTGADLHQGWPCSVSG